MEPWKGGARVVGQGSEATDGLQIAANRWGSVCNALFHETTERLIRCKFMKHRFVSPMREREGGGGSFVFSYPCKRTEIVEDVSSANEASLREDR